MERILTDGDGNDIGPRIESGIHQHLDVGRNPQVFPNLQAAVEFKGVLITRSRPRVLWGVAPVQSQSQHATLRSQVICRSV